MQKTPENEKIKNLKNQNIKTNTDIIAIIGLGFVGLPLAIEFGKIYKTIGFDISKKRINELQNANDCNLEQSVNEIKESKFLTFSANKNDIKNCNIFIITVPTPINKNKTPNLTFLKNAINTTAKVLKKNDFVIFESSIYPTCCRDFCIPLLENLSHLRLNIDFGVGFSPERINPSIYKNNQGKLTDIVKIVSASNDFYLQKISILYGAIIKAGIFKAQSIEIAESAKMLENIQRDVNIAFMNEMTHFFNALNIDSKEVLKACETKWNFARFRPGLVGGHCICINPYYLLHSAKMNNVNLNLIKTARNINENMHKFAIKNIMRQIESTFNKNTNINIKNTQNGIIKNKCNILIIGATYKPNCKDTRNAFAFKIKHALLRNLNKRDKIAEIKICDNLVYDLKLKNAHCDFKNLESSKVLKYHCIIILALHDELKNEIDNCDLMSFLEPNGFIYDINNDLKNYKTITL